VVPGLLDPHVHLRDEELGYKEDFESGTAAAVAGGFTTLLDMPNTRPPVVSGARLRERVKRAEGRLYCDVGFHAYPPDPEDVWELAEAGCMGFKVYLNRLLAGEGYLTQERLAGLLEAARRVGRLVLFHAEALDLLGEVGEGVEAHLAAHRPEVEVETVQRVIKTLEAVGGRAHLCHLSTQGACRLLVEAQARGLDLSAEATPHHLHLTRELVKERGGLAVVEPPLRGEEDLAALREALKGGAVTVLATDHAPHTLEEKLAPTPAPGFPGLEVALPLYLALHFEAGLPLALVLEAVTRRVAERFGLDRVGVIQEGCWANLALVDLREEWVIRGERFLSKAKYTPFEGRRVQGRVKATFVRGVLVYQEGELTGERPGRVLRGAPPLG
jgi:dihydroorotase (multifunctional complex type)